MTKKAVLDSSALVSAFFTPEGTPASLLAHARRGAFSLISSVEILDEVTGVLMRPKHQARYGYTLDEIARYRKRLARSRCSLPNYRRSRPCRLTPRTT